MSNHQLSFKLQNHQNIYLLKLKPIKSINQNNKQNNQKSLKFDKITSESSKYHLS